MAPVVKVQEIVRMDSSNISNNPAANAALSTETEPYGKIVVIKRSGQDSASFELIENGYTFGRAVDCDIRIQLLSISENHCKISRNDHGQAIVTNLSENGTILNGQKMNEDSVVLGHNDLITLVERSFRYEYTPEMMAREQLAKSENTASNNAHVSGTIPLVGETPRKPSSLSASVFSLSEVPSSPITPRTPNAAAIASNSTKSLNASLGQSPKIPPSPMGSAIVDSEITASPKLSPKVTKIEDNSSISLSTGNPFAVINSSTLAGDVTSASDNLFVHENEVEMSEIVVSQPEKNPFDSESEKMEVESEEAVATAAVCPVELAESCLDTVSTHLITEDNTSNVEENREEVIENPVSITEVVEDAGISNVEPELEQVEAESFVAPVPIVEESECVVTKDVCEDVEMIVVDESLAVIGSTEIVCDTTQVIDSCEPVELETITQVIETIETAESKSMDTVSVGENEECDKDSTEDIQNSNDIDTAESNDIVPVPESEVYESEYIKETNESTDTVLVSENLMCENAENVQPTEEAIESHEMDCSVEEQNCSDVVTVETALISEDVQMEAEPETAVTVSEIAAEVTVYECNDIEMAVDETVVVESAEIVEVDQEVNTMEVDTIEEQINMHVTETETMVPAIELVVEEAVVSEDVAEVVVSPVPVIEEVLEHKADMAEAVEETEVVVEPASEVVLEHVAEAVEEPVADMVENHAVEELEQTTIESVEVAVESEAEISDVKVDEKLEAESVVCEDIFESADNQVAEIQDNESIESCAVLVHETEIPLKSVTVESVYAVEIISESIEVVEALEDQVMKQSEAEVVELEAVSESTITQEDEPVIPSTTETETVCESNVRETVCESEELFMANDSETIETGLADSETIETIETIEAVSEVVNETCAEQSTEVEEERILSAPVESDESIKELTGCAVESAEVVESETFEDSTTVSEPIEAEFKDNNGADGAVTEEIVSVDISLMENSNSSTSELLADTSIDAVIVEQSQEEEKPETEEVSEVAASTATATDDNVVVDSSKAADLEAHVLSTPKRSHSESMDCEAKVGEDEATPGPQRKSTRIHHHLTPQLEKRTTRSAIKSKPPTEITTDTDTSTNVRVTRSRAQSTETPISPSSKSRSSLKRKAEDSELINENEEDDNTSTNSRNNKSSSGGAAAGTPGNKRSLRSRVIE